MKKEDISNLMEEAYAVDGVIKKADDKMKESKNLLIGPIQNPSFKEELKTALKSRFNKNYGIFEDSYTEKVIEDNKERFVTQYILHVLHKSMIINTEENYSK